MPDAAFTVGGQAWGFSKAGVMTHADDIHDCLIIGAGPAGLTTATYLTRFRRRNLVLDDGHSRAR